MKPTLNPLPGPRQKLVAGLAAAVFSLLALPALAASSAPERFGDDHDDPRTAYPAVRRPANEPCVVELIDHGFASFDPARATLDAARQCPGPWHKVVMEMAGAAKGPQYDRIGQLSVGGVTIFRTSSPEPSREGI